jgi:thiol-disulfide isomerase/thioredoxin
MKNSIFIFILIWSSSCLNTSSETSAEVDEPVIKTEILSDKKNEVKLNLVADGEPIPTANIKTRENKQINMDRFKNKPLVINYWATWCEPCLTDTPKFQELGNIYPQANFISLSIDKNFAEWQAFLEDKKWVGQHYFIGQQKESPLFPLVYSEIQSEEIRGVHIALPKYIFVSADGTIVKKNSASPQTAIFKDALNEFLR